MRILAAFLTVSGLLSGTAHASSILALSASADTPSIRTLGTTAASASIMTAGTTDPAASPSIIALGESEPGVAYENVAAIGGDGEKPRPRLNEATMVIRGGIVGDAFAHGSGTAASPVLTREASADAESAPPPVQPRAAEVPSQPAGPATAKIE